MVKSNLKKLMALAVVATMIVGSSVTAFAEAESEDGAGTYEGNDVTFGAATTLTVPTAPATGFAYIADPNGLIKESNSSRYDKATWADTAKGIFFKTSGDETNGYVYSEKSAALEVVNNNASPIVVSAKVEQKTAGTSVAFTDDVTFGGTTPSTAKSVYIAITDGTTTKAIKADGAAVEIPISVAGKVGNYELTYVDKEGTENDGYEYTLKSGITTDDATKWNKTSFYVTGFINENADWSGTGFTFPEIKVTWNTTAGAVPMKVKSGRAASVPLTHVALTTISKISVGEATIGADVVARTNPTASAAGTVSITAATAESLYEAIKAMPDGLTLDVEYADGYIESFVMFAK